MNPRFSQVTFLHSAHESPTDSPARLRFVLHSAYPALSYATPLLPYSLSAKESFDFASKHYISRIGRESLIVGFGRGGLIACALQTAFPALRLSVVAINAPTGEIGLQVQACSQAYSRVALYSSLYAPIKDRCDWANFSPMAYDVKWLSAGNNAYYPLSYLISAFMRGQDMDKEVSMMFPAV